MYFWLQFQKTIFIFEINTRAFLKPQSFLQNEKSLNMAPKTPHLNTFRPEFDKFITIFEISTFEFLKKQSFMLKKKKIWDENCLIWVSLEWNLEKIIVIFEISTLKFTKNEFLAIIMNFGKGSVFSKDPGSGSSSLYKVYRVIMIFERFFIIFYRQQPLFRTLF